MNSTVDNKARQMMLSVMEPDKVRVRIRTSWKSGMCLPDKEGEFDEEAVFAVLTFGDNYAIEKAVTSEHEEDGGRVKVMLADLNEYKRLLLKRTLLSWTLDVPIERDCNGWMTSGCYERVARLPAPLVEAFLRGFEESVEITDDEERTISRQCAILFSKSGRGVADACEAVSLFCTLGNYWEKFGLDKNKLPQLPYREYLMLRMMIGKEGEAVRVQSKPKPAGGGTRIAGAGGRARPSRGISTPM